MIRFALTEAVRDHIEPIRARLIKAKPLIEIVVDYLWFCSKRANSTQSASHESPKTLVIVVIQWIRYAIGAVDNKLVDIESPAAVITGIIEDIGFRQTAREAQLQSNLFANVKLRFSVLEFHAER